MKTSKSATLETKWLSNWFDWLRSERGYGINTLAAYQRDLDIFCLFLENEQVSAPRLNRQDFRAFLAEEQAKGLARTTLARRVSSIRSFYRFCDRRAVPLELSSSSDLQG